MASLVFGSRAAQHVVDCFVSTPAVLLIFTTGEGRMRRALGADDIQSRSQFRPPVTLDHDALVPGRRLVQPACEPRDFWNGAIAYENSIAHTS
jgi:hypothetical protein